MRDVIPSMEEFKGLLKAFPSLSAIVHDRLTTVAQVAVLRPCEKSADTTVRCVVPTSIWLPIEFQRRGFQLGSSIFARDERAWLKRFGHVKDVDEVA